MGFQEIERRQFVNVRQRVVMCDGCRQTVDRDTPDYKGSRAEDLPHGWVILEMPHLPEAVKTRLGYVPIACSESCLVKVYREMCQAQEVR